MLYIGQKMFLYMLIVYIIHVECVVIMVSHHLQLNVGCNFIYATNKFLIMNVHCNLI
jgi:hypothetical protein